MQSAQDSTSRRIKRFVEATNSDDAGFSSEFVDEVFKANAQLNGPSPMETRTRRIDIHQ